MNLNFIIAALILVFIWYRSNDAGKIAGGKGRRSWLYIATNWFFCICGYFGSIYLASVIMGFFNTEIDIPDPLLGIPGVLAFDLAAHFIITKLHPTKRQSKGSRS